jgi:hypothetical protein
LIRIRQFHLRGVERDYGVSFLDSAGKVRPLSTIAGEISTGKTSVLEFINYCLGGSRHPVQIEVKRQARSALLEIGANGQIVVIERPLFTRDEIAFVHNCTLEELLSAKPHGKTGKVITPAESDESLSNYLLSQVGLAGISLKEAPSQQASGTDPLSFRDLMWLCYLSARRAGSDHLLHEDERMQELKLRQVVEVVFDVHEDQLAKLSQALKQLEDQVARLRAEIASLERFLAEEEIPTPIELEAQLSEVEERDEQTAKELELITAHMRAQSEFAESLRVEYSEHQQEASTTAAAVRYQETLLRRLIPLQTQYAEDEHKFRFFDEAQALFDPLSLVLCPACLQPLPEPLSSEGSMCSLCHQALSSDVDEPVEVRAELNAIRARKREIDRYLDEVRVDLGMAQTAHALARAAEEESQRRLDDDVARSLSPFIAQREQLVRQRELARAQRDDIERQIRWHATLDRRRMDQVRLQDQATSLRQQIREFEEGRTSKQDVVADLSQRFDQILRSFDYPKLDDPEPPYLDQRFVPHVRGTPYRAITSAGALTLIAVAWQLAVFERAVELGHPHPGFLLIDSPQRGLMAQPDEFTDEQIRLNLWNYLLNWSAASGRSAQMIIVDNAPPATADETVVVRYGGAYGPPPYGLIENEGA